MRAIALAAVLLTFCAVPAHAQRAPAVDFTAGWAGFADESVVHHATMGMAARFPISRRVSVGPEVVYMIGPDGDRDVFVAARLTTDLRTGTADRPPRVIPYAVLSGGVMFHRGPFFWIDEWYRAWSLSGGGGVRTRVTDRVEIGGEARIGSELELRLTGAVSYRFR